MGMPGKTGAVIVGPVIAEIVEQQEGVELAGISETKGTAQLYACALDCGRRLNYASNGPDGHLALPDLD
jgi:hypothetical protein